MFYQFSAYSIDRQRYTNVESSVANFVKKEKYLSEAKLECYASTQVHCLNEQISRYGRFSVLPAS